MPSTDNPTLQKIQREISEVMEREKELRTKYFHNSNGSLDSHHESEASPSPTPEVETIEEKPEEVVETIQEKPKPVLMHSKSMGALTNGTSGTNKTNGTNGTNGINGTTTNGTRRFTPNPAIKGVMHKFFKSRGKLTAALNTISTPTRATTNYQPIEFEPPRVVDPSLCVRKGFVPVEEKMRKELLDLHTRELELRSERRKSQPDFESLVEIESPLEPSNLKKAKSMAQLYSSDEYTNNNDVSPPSRLKPARSMAELCDAPEEVPGSHFLIMRFEELIQKNQQARS